MATQNTYAILAFLPIVAWFLHRQLRRWRFNKFAHIPQMFPPSLFLGNLPDLTAGFKKLSDPRGHADYVFEDIWKSAGHPGMFFLDLRPIAFPMMLITSHKIAEQISKTSKLFPTGVYKSPTVLSAYERLIGRKSIIVDEGDSWRSLRKRFNVGFAPQHLITLLPQIIDKTSIFMSKLDALAESGAEFDMDPLTTNVTFDIMGEIITNMDCKAQDEVSGGTDIVRHFRTLLTTFTDNGRVWAILDLRKRAQRIIASWKVDAAIKKCIKEKFQEIKAAQSTATKQTQDRSVLALALKDTDTLTSDILQSTADQVKSFLFAGHDTTSILLQRLFYALSIHPNCLATIRAEHAAIFGAQDPRTILLTRPDETIKALPYTSACIKETLRLWPPAGGARLAPQGSGFRVQTDDGDDVCLDGIVLYLCHYIIGRDPHAYGETANDFLPERWMGDIDTSATLDVDAGYPLGTNAIPNSAWRPFERGPRHCIGQELANLEARVIIACLVRRYDFIKVGAGEVDVEGEGWPVVDEKGRYRLKSELFNAAIITSRPFDKMRMRVALNKE